MPKTSKIKKPRRKKMASLKVTQNKRSFHVCRMEARDLVSMAYASVRGLDNEKGSVQRFLNSGRISSIRDFALHGGDFPNSIVLNWVSEKHDFTYDGQLAHYSVAPRVAQIIDGQHRVAGLRAAIEQEPRIGGLHIPVAIYNGLPSQDCADIFLAINTEQKPVPKSLVFDLYEIASAYLVDRAAQRARDIAKLLTEDANSPYFGLIKFPGEPKSKRGIALSTVVAGLKPLLVEDGVLELVGAGDLETQSAMIMNYFNSLSELYGENWIDQKNVFRYAAGFTGAMHFFRNKLVDYCNVEHSFKSATMRSALESVASDLILQEEVKNLQGSRAVAHVANRLAESFSPKTSRQVKFEV